MWLDELPKAHPGLAGFYARHVDSAGELRSVRSRESDLLQWLYALSIDESLTAEQVRENARGALAEYLGEPQDRLESGEEEAGA